MSDFEYIFDINKSIDDDLYIYGVASNKNLDRDSESVDMESLESCFKTYMASNPVVCYNHDTNKAIGKVVPEYVGKDGTVYKSEITNGLLKVVVKLSDTANDILKQIKEEILKSFSVGGRARHVSKNAVTTLVFIDLYEISVVPVGANKESLFSIVKSVCTGSNCPNKIKGDESMDTEQIREIVKSVMAETETEDVVKTLTEQVATLTAELEAAKATGVTKGIVEGEAPVETATDITSLIMAKHYGGN